MSSRYNLWYRYRYYADDGINYCGWFCAATYREQGTAVNVAKCYDRSDWETCVLPTGEKPRYMAGTCYSCGSLDIYCDDDGVWCCNSCKRTDADE